MVTKTKVKNPYGKMVRVDSPYFTLKQGDWEWKVLRIYKSPASTLKDPYARAFCAVTSPFTFGGCDMGDVYVKDIPGLASKLREVVRREAEDGRATT